MTASTESTDIAITAAEIQKVAHLARLRLDNTQIEKHAKSLGHILGFIAQIDAIDTSQVEPMACAMDNTPMAWRADVVTAENQREVLQKLAPAVTSGLYLVPQVIE